MTEDECRAFERDPGWEAAVKLRRWDDEGKVAGAATRSFAEFEPMLRRLAGQPT